MKSRTDYKGAPNNLTSEPRVFSRKSSFVMREKQFFVKSNQSQISSPPFYVMKFATRIADKVPDLLAQNEFWNCNLNNQTYLALTNEPESME